MWRLVSLTSLAETFPEHVLLVHAFLELIQAYRLRFVDVAGEVAHGHGLCALRPACSPNDGCAFFPFSTTLLTRCLVSLLDDGKAVVGPAVRVEAKAHHEAWWSTSKPGIVPLPQDSA